MTRFYPDALTAPASDPRPGETRAYMQPHRRDPEGWRWSNDLRRAYTAHRVTVIDTMPVTVVFDRAWSRRDVNPDWRSVTGDPLSDIPAGTPVVLGRACVLLACLWEDVEAWHAHKQAETVADLDRAAVRKAVEYRDELDATPGERSTIEVDALSFARICEQVFDWRGHSCVGFLEELETLRANACRADEVIAEAEAEEAAVLAQAHRDGLGAA